MMTSNDRDIDQFVQFQSVYHTIRYDRPIVFDTGATISLSPSERDFISWDDYSSASPNIQLQAVNGMVSVANVGTLQWTIYDDSRVAHTIVTKGFYVPESPIRLFSPQSYLQQPDVKGKGGRFVMSDNECYFMFPKLSSDGPGRKRLTFHMHHLHPLPVAFPDDRLDHPKYNWLHGRDTDYHKDRGYLSVVDDTNTNIDLHQKELLRWHFRFGHFNMEWIKTLMRVPRGREGDNPREGETSNNSPIIPLPPHSKASTCVTPLCAACQYAKAHRRADEATRTEKVPAKDGILKHGDLRPGQMVSTDQFVSQLGGRLPHTKGKEKEIEQYHGGTIFVDHASGFVYLQNQVSLNAAETIRAKNSFEREARNHGIHITGYRGDNGVYRSNDWRQDLHFKGQTMEYSGVGAHHQNGIAERAIRTISESARSMLLHAALHWPDGTTLDLWPFAVDYAVYIWNRLPRADNGLAPVEVFYGVKQDHSILSRIRVWGCPSYVLDPVIQDGKKLPRWQPKSRRGQFMGMSKLHSSTIGMIRNLRTGSISPQFHVVYDEWFSTLPNDPSDQQLAAPEVWQDLIVISRDEIGFDKADIPPQLHPDWLTNEEADRRAIYERKRQRERNLLPADEPADIVVANDDDDFPVPDNVVDDPFVDDDDEEVEPVVPEQRRLQRERRPNPKYYGPEYVNAMTEAQQKFGILDFNDAFIASMNSIIDKPTNHETTIYTVMHADKVDEDGLLDALHPLAFAARANADDTPNFSQAMTGPDAEGFYEAMKQELISLESLDAWEEVPREAAAGRNIIPTTWAFKRKRYPDGSARKLKARLCVRGDRQVEGVDFFETYAPVVSWTTIRLLLVLSVVLDLQSVQVDYTTAFVQADIDDEVYIEMPRLFERQGYILKLRKSLYGLRQAPLNFFNCLREALESRGFRQSMMEPCLFTNNEVICLCYVDDCLFFSRDINAIERVLEDLQQPTNENHRAMLLQRESDVAGFLGIKMLKLDDGRIELTQPGLIERIISVMGLQDSNAKFTPTESKPLPKDDLGPTTVECWSYSSVVGMMMYLTSNSRPDIAFAVHQCARFTHSPKRVHEHGLKRIARYLLGTKDKGMILAPTGDLKLDLYADADFAGLWGTEDATDSLSVKSRTGYVITLGGSPLVWGSKLQTEIALSTLEAEYIALSTSMRVLLPLRDLVKEVCEDLGIERDELSLVSTVFEDNAGCLILANAPFPNMTPRTKHIAIKYHWFRSHIKFGEIEVVKIDTKVQKADIFTKGLKRDEFESKRKMLVGW